MEDNRLVEDKVRVLNEDDFFLLSLYSKKHNRFHGQELYE